MNGRIIRMVGAAAGAAVLAVGLPRPASAADQLKQVEPKGCAEQCITKAWVKGRAPTLSLEVRTKVPAKLLVKVSEQAPSITATGPKFASVKASASTGNQLKSAWTTDLGPLSPGTRYHIVVWATDKNGNTAYQRGTFETPEAKPAKDQAAGGALKTPGEGCQLQCITKAWIQPAKGSAAIEVRTKVPARIEVQASTKAPAKTAGGPKFDSVDASAGTGGKHRTQWNAELAGLEPGTKYHVVVRAVDQNGKGAYQQGSFWTHDVVRNVKIVFNRIHVVDDADRNNWGEFGRGELRLYFGVGDQWARHLDQGEEKVKSGRTYGLPWDGGRPGSLAVLVEDAPDDLVVKVQGVERDKFGKGFGFQFCSEGVPPYSGSGGSGPCLDYATASLALEVDELSPGLHERVFETRDHRLKFHVVAFVSVTEA